jgi:DNA repair exonuclease SbcCD ATPase subunit
MGAISDGLYNSSNRPSLGYKDGVAKYNQELHAQENATKAAFAYNMTTSIFGSLLSLTSKAISKSAGNSNDNADYATIEASYKNDIQTLLDKYGCQDVDSFNIKVNNQLTEANQSKAEIANINSNITALSSQPTAIDTNIGALTKERTELSDKLTRLSTFNQAPYQSNFADADLKGQDPEALEQELEDLDKKIEEQQKQSEAITKQIAELEAKKPALQTKVDKIGDLQQDQANMETLVKNLQKVKGQTTLDNLTNKESQAIVNIRKEYQSATDEKSKDKLREKLQDAFYAYYEKHNENDNKTIDNLCSELGLKKTKTK